MSSLIDRISEAVKGNITKAKLTSTEEAVRQFILKKFAQNGKAPSLAEIKAELGLSSTDTCERSIEKLTKNDILAVKDGRIVSTYPFSAKETRHRVIFGDGHEVYALCSTDALGIHFMMGENITVLSKCPETEEEIKIVLEGGRIVSCNPQGVVEFISSGGGGCCTCETFCPYMNFFSSEKHLEKWRMKNPAYGNGETYSPHETLRHGEKIFGDFLKDFSYKEAQSVKFQESGHGVKIECFMSIGCGSEAALRENIKAALALEGNEAEVAFHRIKDEEAFALGLTGSPSVIINGQNIEPQELTGFS